MPNSTNLGIFHAPKDSDRHRSFGLVLTGNDRLEASLGQFEIASLIDPENWPSHLNRAEAVRRPRTRGVDVS